MEILVPLSPARWEHVQWVNIFPGLGGSSRVGIVAGKIRKLDEVGALGLMFSL